MVVTTEPAEPSRRRASWWWLAWAVVVVAVTAVTLMLTTGHAGDGETGAADGTPVRTATSTATSTAGDSGYDLTTPEAAAKSFAAAAATNDGDTLLSLACVGHLACVDEHDLDPDRLTAARAVITENTFELADHLTGAEFSPAVDGAVPGAKDVPYRTPAMTGDALPTLTFVQSGGDWLYLGPAT